MKKPIRLIFLICTLLSPVLLQAHAVVIQTSINIAPIKANKKTDISLNFNSKIEIALSKFFLISAGDKEQLIVGRKGKKKGEIFVSIPALKKGDYALKFKVFSVDGHLTEDIIRFKVTP